MWSSDLLLTQFRILAQPGFTLRLLLQNALRLPLVAGRLNQVVTIDVPGIGDNQRIIAV
ncbi:hypothetical protein O2064_000236 [Enterobacter hormaechei]|nr:hypothetical protein [Enterobacter hormaechei]